jgi:hypothetical protein
LVRLISSPSPVIWYFAIDYAIVCVVLAMRRDIVAVARQIGVCWFDSDWHAAYNLPQTIAPTKELA